MGISNRICLSSVAGRTLFLYIKQILSLQECPVFLRSLKEEESIRLFQSMKNVLTDALKHGGYLEKPFYKGDTLTGSYNQFCKVYDRENQPCIRCQIPIKKTTIASRKSFFCPFCQK
ncbi:hypothetical protein BIV60_16950 [Bacillus sp. MUM 116]|uniref:zinc finger domain-containing protein n=1 Tax=Bacillus sp. MUM 116 TaxID=1678002 RepID=UPI0008F5D802|nr:zinc finger domain-containing protein [Bacillus sp. MUM 116]OIK12063.1 hypothetical protein BIV60_16950 [Bacillus sp. MUM 116]